MTDARISPELLDLLNQALARELQVSIQYMLQHTIASGLSSAPAERTPSLRQSKFISSDAMIYLPGWNLRKIAISEMRHAEAIAERIAVLGEEPTTQPNPVILGASPIEMLEVDREQERSAIALYGQIIELSRQEQDDTTGRLFQHILRDEQKHYRVFSGLLESG